jgi:predicted RNase H-like HicB family nuclease
MTVVHVERDEAGYWIATSPEVPGMVTQAKRLDHIAERAREAIALVQDVRPTKVNVELEIAEQENAFVQRYREAREDAENAATEASIAARAAVYALRSVGMSNRDAGALLGISHQRVQQLADETKSSKKAAPARKAAARKAPAKKAPRRRTRA